MLLNLIILIYKLYLYKLLSLSGTGRRVYYLVSLKIILYKYNHLLAILNLLIEIPYLCDYNYNILLSSLIPKSFLYIVLYTALLSYRREL